jgi:TPR repeat protein
MTLTKAERQDRLFERATKIRDGQAVGHYLPIFKKLAISGDVSAMCALADWLADDPVSVKRALLLYRKAYRAGYATAAWNRALTHFYRNEMGHYRLWLRKATKHDEAAGKLFKCFDTRLPFPRAKQVRRIRPFRKYD